jgi:LPXTG-site transpeptidase (sortase) family protein
MLKWIERTLLVVGVVVGLWCAKILIVARYTQSLSIPEQYVTVNHSLPGDEGSADSTEGTPGSRGTAGTRSAPRRGAVLARLEAPTLHLSTIVLEGSDDGTLARGAGHIEDTPFPGDAGNIGIAGHRDTVFRPLRNAKPGDELDLKTANRVDRYRVTRTLIVKPDDVYVLDPTSTPTLTLVTCWPFEFIGHAPKRFIVQAERVGH